MEFKKKRKLQEKTSNWIGIIGRITWLCVRMHRYRQNNQKSQYIVLTWDQLIVMYWSHVTSGIRFIKMKEQNKIQIKKQKLTTSDACNKTESRF